MRRRRRGDAWGEQERGTAGRYGAPFRGAGTKSTIAPMHHRGATFLLNGLCGALVASLVFPLQGCVGPGPAGRAGAPGPVTPAATPAASTPVGATGAEAGGDAVADGAVPADGSTAAGAAGSDGAAEDTKPAAASAVNTPAKEAAAVQMAQLFGLLGEDEAAPLLVTYADTNGMAGAADILVRLEPEKRSKLIRELQRTQPDEVAGYLSALQEALARSSQDTPGRTAEAAEVIDAWHAAAARGDREAYLGAMTPRARFLGTDSSERWDMSQFTAYVNEHFRPGRGWTFVPSERVVLVSPAGDFAWFDERLQSESYGELRGTGVLERGDDGWRVAHYSMTFTVPNAVAGQVVEVVGGADD